MIILQSAGAARKETLQPLPSSLRLGTVRVPTPTPLRTTAPPSPISCNDLNQVAAQGTTLAYAAALLKAGRRGGQGWRSAVAALRKAEQREAQTRRYPTTSRLPPGRQLLAREEGGFLVRVVPDIARCSREQQ